MKKDIRQYRHLINEIRKLEDQIRRKEHDAESVPGVMGKVQSSQKEWPYLPTSEQVEIPEVRQYNAIMKSLFILRTHKARVEEEAASIYTFISGIEDSAKRQLLIDVCVNGLSQKDAAIAYDLTEGRISQIITEANESYAGQ